MSTTSTVVEEPPEERHHYEQMHDKTCMQRCCYLDPEARKQLQLMLDYIDQEALEKIDEIDTQTTEEYQKLKSTRIEEQYAKIFEEYENLESRYNTMMLRKSARYENRGRLKVLQMRQNYIAQVVEETKLKLREFAKPENPQYVRVLRLLIIEAMLMLLEPKMFLTIRKKDRQITRTILPGVIEQYKKLTESTELEMIIDSSRRLSDHHSGGIILRDERNLIKVDNTLNVRLYAIVHKIFPKIRLALFNDRPIRPG